MGWGSTGRVVTAVFRLECRFRLVDTIVALLEVLLHEWKFSCGLIMLGHPPLPWCVVPLEFSDVDTCTSTCETLWAWGNCALQVLTNMAEFSASVLDRWLVLEIRRVLFIILLSDFYCLLLFGKLLAICQQQQQRPQPLRPTPCFSSISAPFSEVVSSHKKVFSFFLLSITKCFGAKVEGNIVLVECTWNFFWWPRCQNFRNKCQILQLEIHLCTLQQIF